jgi:type II secretory pathway pseudopilin PulG
MLLPVRKSPVRGFSFAELLILLAILAILGSLLVPYYSHLSAREHLSSSICNARQIHIAAMSMASDGAANKDPGLGWPGDLKANGKIATVQDYVNALVHNDYLKPGDLKIFSAAGMDAYPGGTLTSGSNGILVPRFEEKNTIFKVFLVKDEDPAPTVFMATKNYTYNTPLNDPTAPPYGNKGFVVCRKGGDASYYKQQQAQQLQLIGKLPGGGNAESTENCLNPGPFPQ